MSNFTLAMLLKPLIFGAIVFALWWIIPAGKIKTALFRERPWTLPAWLVGMSLFIFVFALAAYRIITD